MKVFAFVFFLLLAWFGGLYLLGTAAKNFNDYKKEHVSAFLLQGSLWIVIVLFCMTAVFFFFRDGFFGALIGIVFASFSAFDPFEMTKKKAEEYGRIAREQEELKTQQEEAKRAAKREAEAKKKAYEQALAETRGSDDK